MKIQLHRAAAARLSTALALSLSIALCSMSAWAEQTVIDQTRFKLRTAQGAIEVVEVENLQPGQTRSLHTQAGTPVIVGRHEGGYVIDIQGERIEVDTPEVLVAEGSDPLVLGHAQGKQVVVKRIGKASAADAAGEPDATQHPQHKVVMIKRKAHGDGGTEIRIAEDEADAMALLDGLDVEDPQLPDGQRVMVVRKIEKRHSAPQ
jgi:hypothetical protein